MKLEDVYIKIINTPTYKSMKIAEKLREKGERVVEDREALGKLLKCHPFPRYQGPFTNTMEGKMYEFNSPEDDTYDFKYLIQHSSIGKHSNVKFGKL